METGDGVVASIRIEMVKNPGRLDTLVHLVPDQVVVLASTRPPGLSLTPSSTTMTAEAGTVGHGGQR